jgi:threonine/homoserine/homoserine lactone efflux protein
VYAVRVWVYLVFGITFGLAAAAMPGPLMTYLVSQTLSAGWRRTMPAAFSPLLTDGPIAVLVLLVLSQVPSWMETALRFAGGLFLLYLAWGALRAWKRFSPQSVEPSAQTGQRTLLKAAGVNFLNPGPYLGWSLVLGPMFLRGWREAPAFGAALLGSFYGTMLACNAGVIFLFAAARNLGPRVNRALLGLSALGLASFGIYQLVLGASALLQL